MHITELSPNTLHQAIIKGCQSVISAKDALNAINVFPVADGDTGDNLASTASAILHHSYTKECFNEMLSSVANASVQGARGNSGVIFSQFFNGLATVQHHKKIITPVDFSAMLVIAARFVRASILSPVEGTMLTMIEDFANTSSRLSENTHCFNGLMEQLIPHLMQTLNNTKNSIPILKEADIVDAGALGFYLFVEGVASVLSNSVTIEQLDEKKFVGHIKHQHNDIDTPPTYRYCTEAILRADTIDTEGLTEALKQHGDSLVFAGNQQMCKFHIHTNQPAEVFSILMDHGTIDYSKIDDMLRQYEVTHHRKHKIALVTDSSADIPQTLSDEYQLHLIPLNIHLGEHSLLDRYCFKPDVFYQRLNAFPHYPKTSLPGPSLIEEKLHYLSQHYEHVIVLSIAKAISGTFDVMSQVAQKYHNIKVLDSKTNSGAHGLLVQYAGELINAGLSFQTIIEHLEEAIPETSLFVMVNDLEAMIRSGRINKVAGRIGRFSGMKPIVSIDKEGKGVYFSTSFNTHASLSKIISIAQKILSQSGKKLESYCIVHAGAEKEAHEFASRITQALKISPAYIEFASPIIGLHAGHGCIALAIRMGPA